MRKTTIFSVFLGTLIEVYDFHIFAFLVPILTEAFFSSYEKSIGVSFTLLAYVISYAIKPIGSLGFGYLIDYWGRKKILLITTLLMVFSTVAIGLLPTNMRPINIWIYLIVCRIIQGFSISGEFGSAIIMAIEQGGNHPGYSGSLVFAGGITGILFANLSVFILFNLLPHKHIIQFGWRIPFLISTLMWVIIFWVRNNIDDIKFTRTPTNLSLFKLIANQKKELASTFIISSLSASALYITFIHMPTYLSSTLNLHSHQNSILITLISLFVYLCALPIGGFVADNIGIQRQIKISTFLYLVFSYGCFTLLKTLNVIGTIFVLITYALIQALLNSALPAYMVTKFDPSERGKALAISYNVALTIFGGLMPYLILTSKMQLNPGIPISICAVLTLLIINYRR